MANLERPKKGDPITHEWACQLVDAILELQKNPKVIPPLISKDGAIGFGDVYAPHLVQTTTTITARSGATMGTGSVKFVASPGGAMSASAGTNAVRPVRSILGNAVPVGTYGYILWVNGEWHLVSADCAGS